MKYIDADKLIAEVQALKRRKGFLPIENTEITEAYMARGVQFTCDDIMNLIQSLQQEQEEVELEKFTEKMDAWKARYNYPDNIMVKGAMAFTARMFYMYPKVAREWYDSLPKVTQD